MSWEIKTVSEIASPKKHSMSTGPFGSAISSKYFLDSGIPIIRGKNLSEDVGVRLSDKNLVFLSSVKAEKFKRSIARQGDIIFTCWGTINQIGLIDKRASYEEYVVSNKQMKLTIDSSKADYLFLYYQFSSPMVQQEILNNNLGGAIPGFNLGQLKKFKVQIPPLQTQKRIADILSVYDDLIENNLKRIKLLEQAAQNIYKEWFVNLRFPGHENTSINEETGLPEGWWKKTIEEYTKIVSRGPSLNYKVDKGIPVLNQSCIRNGEIELDKILIAEKLKENKEHCYLKINDVLINSMGQGTLGRVSKNNSISEKFIVHNCITFLRAKKEYSQTLLYYFISSKTDYFISISQGSTGQTTLKLSLIKELEINTPTTDLMKLFDYHVLPMWNQIGQLKKQNQKLEAARDILLPRLMNRTIEV